MEMGEGEIETGRDEEWRSEWRINKRTRQVEIHEFFIKKYCIVPAIAK